MSLGASGAAGGDGNSGILDNAGAAGAASGDTGGAASGAGGSGAAKSWIDDLPEDIRGEAALKVIKDIPNLAKSYLNAQRLVGADKIAVPGKNASPEDWKQAFRKLGLPESVDKYDIKAPEGSNAELIGKFKQVAHAAGILPSQAEKVLGLYSEINKGALESQQTLLREKMEKGVEGLRKEWGQGWDKEVASAKAAKEAFGDPDFDKFLDENNLRSDPAMIKFLNRVGKTLGEGAIKGGEGGGGGFGSTPAELQTQINSITSNPDSGYFNGEHPNHKAAVATVQKLYSQMYPNKTG